MAETASGPDGGCCAPGRAAPEELDSWGTVAEAGLFLWQAVASDRTAKGSRRQLQRVVLGFMMCLSFLGTFQSGMRRLPARIGCGRALRPGLESLSMQSSARAAGCRRESLEARQERGWGRGRRVAL